MMKNILTGIVSLSLVATLGACGDDADNCAVPPDSAPTPDSPVTPGPTFKQVEQLARPGIAEALLLSDGFLAGYNATAPTFAGVDAATLGMVVAEAKTVLKAVYLGTCLVNGVAGLTAVNGAHPAGLECAAVGGALFTENSATGVTLTQTAKDGAQAYADKVFDQFEPDVMRIDTSAASAYGTPCGDLTTKPLLCGGRRLDDDVIDATYFYLIAGLSVPSGLSGNVPQAVALTSDGVSFAGNNVNQGHPAVSNTFPYSAPPI